MLTSDVEYSNRFRSAPMTHRQRMLHGMQSAGVGFYEGTIGIVKEPLVGWQVWHWHLWCSRPLIFFPNFQLSACLQQLSILKSLNRKEFNLCMHAGAYGGLSVLSNI